MLTPPTPRPAGKEASLSCCNARIGFFGVAALVLLRITIGWHLLYEGLHKLNQEEFSAEGYLSQAAGPFQKFFQYTVIQDFEGRDRLSTQGNDAQIDDFYARFQAQFGLDATQKQTAERIVAARKKNIADYLTNADNAKLIADNQAAWKKLNEEKAAYQSHGGAAPFQDRRLWEATQTLRSDVRPAIVWVKQQHDGLKNDLKNLLPRGERRDVTYPLAEQLRNPDRLVTYACIAMGACLMVGLFSRLAAFGGALFLAMIVASRLQWTGYYMPPTHPAQGNSLFITKEFIEMMCCIVLMTLPVGRWGGLDFIVHNTVGRMFSRD